MSQSGTGAGGTIVGIAGSLRRGSLNAALLRAAREAMPAGWELEILSIADVPLYDGDVESAAGIPAAVRRLKARVREADGLLIATPEYNQSVPGVLKNAIDWMTRPPDDVPEVFHGLPVALMGATPGASGTRPAQAAWLPVMRALRVRLFAPTLYLPRAGRTFDDAMHLIDTDVDKRLREYLQGFADHVAASAR